MGRRPPTFARALETRALFLIDALLYAIFSLVSGVGTLLRSLSHLRMRHVVFLSAVGAFALYERQHWHACAPTVDAQLAGHAVVASSRPCDPRAEHHALFAQCGLDCARPRETLARGRTAAMLACVVARQPFAAYGTLLLPLLYPERAHALDWMQAAAIAAAALVLFGWLVMPCLAWRREERLHGEVHTLVHALNRSGARAHGAGARAYVPPHERGDVRAIGGAHARGERERERDYAARAGRDGAHGRIEEVHG